MYPSLTQRSWNGLKQGWKSPTGEGELSARQGSMESLGNSGREDRLLPGVCYRAGDETLSFAFY